MFVYQYFIINYVAYDSVMSSKQRCFAPHVLFYMTLPTYLAIGLVADICVGRYKIIIASIYCAFIGWITLCVSFYVTYNYVHFTLVLVGYSLGTIGAAGIQSIAVPFNIDQMVGATADELSTIIYWHCFGLPLADSLAEICNCFIDEVYQQSIGICVSGVAITMLMVTYYLLKHHLDTTPLLTNPVKLIVKVLNYARKNKYPRNRSALTYWEESAPSRLDLDKDKYGGPFTEEEVEDVKTFLRYLPLLVCTFGFTVTIVIPSFKALTNTSKVMLVNSCLLQKNGISHMTISILLVAYKVVFSKCCYKCVPSMLKRIGLGLCLLLLCMLVLVAMDLQDYTTANNCTLAHIIYDGTNTNYILTSLFEVISGIGSAIVLITSLELTVAQSPVHIRGLMVGVWYGANGVFIVLSYAIYVPHTLIHSHCTLYYHVTVSVCVVVTISVYGVLAKCYKLRTRNDPVNIPHIVATVYERYIEQSKQHKQLHGGSEILTYESIED